MEDAIYKIEKKGDVVVMTLTLDNVVMDDNIELQKAFTELLDKGNKNLILDLSRTNFISSIVSASLVFMLKRSKEAGGNIVLCGIKDAVRRVLDVTNLDKVFDIFDDRQKATAQFT